MRVFELMAFLAKQRADAEVVVYGDGLLSSDITDITDKEAGPDYVHILIKPDFVEEETVEEEVKEMKNA